MRALSFIKNKILIPYRNSFHGLSKEVWWLALITLINRAGTMVIPFLSLYLINSLEFSVENVAWIMSAFGFGSVVGSWLGGKLTDLVGYYRVMFISLLLTGVLFVLLRYLTGLFQFCLGIFVVMVVADTFRPAMFVALGACSKPENKTRSLTLIRLAINLGFSAGPAIGGLIITKLGYSGLFWVDGITCFLASLLLLYALNPKKAKVLDVIKNENPSSAYSNNRFLVFLVAMMIFGLVFLQYFSTVPVFYEKQLGYSEFKIGMLLAMNGFLIFLLEMPLIKWLEQTKYTKVNLMLAGTLMVTASLLILNLSDWFGVIIIGMLLMTVGEMVFFPFSNSFALDCAKHGNQGEYMGLYTIAFSLSHVFGHNLGFQIIDNHGFYNTWYVMTLLGAFCVILLLLLKRKTNQNTLSLNEGNK
ncbi:MAG: MFS transporter [Bacteroidota bacterium]